MTDPNTLTLGVGAALSIAAQLIAYGKLQQQAATAATSSGRAIEAVEKLGKEVAEVRGILLGQSSNGNGKRRHRR